MAPGASSPREGLLGDLVVLDLTRNVAGPFCTMTLADLGADVVKIERPGAGDDTREWRPPEWNGESATFLSFNRNKRSLAVDIDREEGQDIVRKLALRADVLVESFRVGSLDKRGLGYERLREANPRLVYCSISAYGQRGPNAARSAYDPVIQAYSGMMSMTGEEGRPPVRTGPATIDVGTGVWAAFGILAALYERQKTGRGGRVEASLLETGLSWMSYHLAGFMGTGVNPRKLGSRGGIAAPYEAFSAADEDLYIAAPNDALFDRLCRVLDLGSLPSDPRFRTNPERIGNREALRALVESRLRTRSAAEWESLLAQNDVPCSRIRTAAQVVSDPHVEALGVLSPVPHPRVPDLRLVDLPVSLDGRRARMRLSPPALGEHTDEILESLGITKARASALRAEGVVT